MISTQKRSYVTWTPQMDMILTSTLLEQITGGNKGDGDFKPQAYRAVVDKLRLDLRLNVTIDHVKNRIKVWKKHYATITEIRTYTKFIWDDERKMIKIRVEDLVAWQDYCKDNPSASAYQNKQIDNWDDICTLVAVDRAVGDGVEQHEESASAMEAENEGVSTSETPSGESNKRLKRDRLADAVSSFAKSFKDYLKAKDPPKPTSSEVYDVVSNVLGITRHQILRVVKRFLGGTVEEFDMLKRLPKHEKLDWILSCLE
ncbi:hypothetical protein BVRB_9g202990 [Beta vulgaris subsp. vulgaris]|nr:hypothetical protein BVRB_9g202990 [Beta vulgaris subsp. vulgaris]